MKVLRIFEDAIDWIYRIIFILIMLIGLYYVYDTIYVFYNASAERYMVSGQTGYSEDVVKELTEDYVAWLSIDDTNINYPIMQGGWRSTLILSKTLISPIRTGKSTSHRKEAKPMRTEVRNFPI